MAGRIPGWLKTNLPDLDALAPVRRTVTDAGLNTICFEARCPNKRECFEAGSVSFLLLGRSCTRRCAFCNVSGAPPDEVDTLEPEKLKSACAGLGMKYVVLTSVTRDDLPDGGASHFAGCVQAIKSLDEAPVVEVLVPDFRGCEGPVETAAGSGAEVFAHNVETVPRLYGRVRDRASYTRSLSVLRTAGKAFPDVIVKSGLMVGLGETLGEVKSVIGDLREAGCTIVTVGQYLRPSGKHHPVDRYYEPREFEELREYSEELGLVAVAGPKVRSSYLASTAYMKVRQGGRDADRGHLEIS